MFIKLIGGLSISTLGFAGVRTGFFGNNVIILRDEDIENNLNGNYYNTFSVENKILLDTGSYFRSSYYNKFDEDGYCDRQLLWLEPEINVITSFRPLILRHVNVDNVVEDITRPV